MIEFDMNWNWIYDTYDSDDYFLWIFYRNFWKLHFMSIFILDDNNNNNGRLSYVVSIVTTVNSCKFLAAGLGTRDRNATECVVSGHVDNAAQIVEVRLEKQ